MDRRPIGLVALLVACASAEGEDTEPRPPGSAPDAGTVEDPGAPPFAFSTVSIAEAATLTLPGDGDLWPSCWSDDGELYAAWGDGFGFDHVGRRFTDIGVARITGSPAGNDLAGQNLAIGDAVGQVWTAGAYNRKPTGMACIGGDLYLAVQDLRLDFNDVPAATIARSRDKGRTWEWDRSAPMFGNHVMTTLFFADHGRDGGTAPDGYVYVYGLDHNWRDSFNDRVPDPTRLYLARVPGDALQDRGRWEFFAGLGEEGAPRWSGNLDARVPVLEDERRLYGDTVYNFGNHPRNMTVLSQGSVVHLPGLGRYLYTSWTEFTFELYEAPAPWGPFQHVHSKDFGPYPWTGEKNGGYATTIPSKFISPDGRRMYVQSNTFVGGWRNYSFSLRELALEPRVPSEPTNRPGEPIPTRGEGAVPLASTFHFGRSHVLGDGASDLQEDSWNGQRKQKDAWGYVWPRTYRVNRLTYVTGGQFGDGGWFSTLGVEVRRDGAWTPVEGLAITPAYPFASVAPRSTFVLRFDTATGDGIRLIGAPAGTASFTSIADLAVGYDGP